MLGGYLSRMAKTGTGVRFAEVDRETKETRVSVVLDLDGGAKRDIQTTIGFFDHMLDLMAFHGRFNLGLKCDGDTFIDDHHSVEDTAIVLGQAFHKALAMSNPIDRYGSVHQVMDEALVLVAIDISGRGMLTFDVPFNRENLGEMATENVREFFRAFAAHAGWTVHIHKLAGVNDHHVCEAIFKGFGRALRQAISVSDGSGPMSTKGKID